MLRQKLNSKIGSAGSAALPIIAQRWHLSAYKIALRCLVYAVVLLVPLAFVPQGAAIVEAQISFVEVPKTFIFRLLTTLMLPLVAWGFLASKPRLSPVLVITLLFTLWHLVATLTSWNVGLSFWGEFPGQDSYSFLTFFHLLILTLAVGLAFDSQESRYRLLSIIAVSGALASVPVILQQFEAFPIDLMVADLGQPSGTFGNPVFASAFLLLAFCTTGYALLQSKQDGIIPKWRTALVACLALQLMALSFLEGRAAWLGVGVFVVVLAVWALRHNPRIAVGLIAALLTAGVVAVSFGGSSRVLNAPAELKGRTTLWTGSALIIQEHLFNGAGPDMFRYAYLRISPPGPEGIPEEPDHAHNFVIHQAVETGVIGGALALLLLLVPALIRSLPLAGIFLAHFAEQMLGVGRISDLMLFFVLLGVAHHVALEKGFVLQFSVGALSDFWRSRRLLPRGIPGGFPRGRGSPAGPARSGV